MGAALQRAAIASPPRYERRRPEQTLRYRLVREHYETFASEIERAAGGAGLPQFVKDEFDAYLDCGIPRLRGGGALLRTASCACAARAAHATYWWRSVASGAASARHVAQGAWRRRRPI